MSLVRHDGRLICKGICQRISPTKACDVGRRCVWHSSAYFPGQPPTPWYTPAAARCSQMSLVPAARRTILGALSILALRHAMSCLYQEHLLFKTGTQKNESLMVEFQILDHKGRIDFEKSFLPQVTLSLSVSR